MMDTRFYFFALDSDMLEGIGANQLKFSAPVWMHSPEFLDQHGEGWRPVDHTIVPTPQGYTVSVMMQRELHVPGSDTTSTP